MYWNKLSCKIIIFFLPALFFFFSPIQVRAIPFGTLLYKTGPEGKMYGLNEFTFQPFLNQLHLGGVGIYVGKIDNEPKVIEVSYGRVRMIPARFFIDLDVGEEFVGAKIPKGFFLNELSRRKFLGHILAQLGEKEDYLLASQKGPLDGEWTSVGLAEKLYESALNPTLTYHQTSQGMNRLYYSFNITPDGYDNEGTINQDGDCFSQAREFSRIHRFGQGNFWEKFFYNEIFDFLSKAIGRSLSSIYNLNLFGQLKNDELYIFAPYTQYLQPTLQEVKIDIPIASNGKKYLSQMISASDAQEEAFWSLLGRLIGDFGIAELKKEIFAKINFYKFIQIVQGWKTKLSLLNSGLQFFGVKNDTTQKIAVIPEKITDKIKNYNPALAGSLGELQNFQEDADAAFSEGGEMAEREGKNLLFGPEAQESTDHFVSQLQIEEKKNNVLDTSVGQTSITTSAPVVPVQINPIVSSPQEKITTTSSQDFFSGDVVINEIFSFPLSGQKEWIEFYNTTDQKIDLKDFTIEDNNGPEFGQNRATALAGLAILPKSFLVVVQGEKFNFSLNNGGDILILKFKQKIIDKMSYGDFDDGETLNNAIKPETGEALARSVDGVDSDFDGKDFSLTVYPTPGQPNHIVAPNRLQNSSNSSPPIPNSSPVSNPIIIQVPVITPIENNPTPTTYQPYNYLDVVINEIAWMGTLSESLDEWIELYNRSDKTVNLEGFILASEDDGLKIKLRGSLPAHSYRLLERGSDQAVSAPADQIYQGNLGDTGEDLILSDGTGKLIDNVSCSGGWFVGDIKKKLTMERIDPFADGNLVSNWKSFTLSPSSTLTSDRNGQIIMGTPKKINSSLADDHEEVIFLTNILTQGYYRLDNWPQKIEGTASAYTVSSSLDVLESVRVSLKNLELNKYWRSPELIEGNGPSSWSSEELFLTPQLGAPVAVYHPWQLDVTGIEELPQGHYAIEAKASSSNKEQAVEGTSTFILDKNSPAVPSPAPIEYDAEADELKFLWPQVEDFSGIQQYEIIWSEDEIENTATSKNNFFIIKNPLGKIYSFKVKATDLAGYMSDWSENKVYQFQEPLAAWRQNEKIIISNENQPKHLKDYALRVVVPYKSGMKTDFSDLRFIQKRGRTDEILPYWRENYSSSQTATFWIKMPFLCGYLEEMSCAARTSIYIYYDNPASSYIGNGDEVFFWFDPTDSDHLADYQRNSLDRGCYNTQYLNSGCYRLINNFNGPVWISPKDLTIKNFSAQFKAKTAQEDYPHEQMAGIQTRVRDDNNFYSFNHLNNYSAQISKTVSSSVNILDKKSISALPASSQGWETLEVSFYESDARFIIKNPQGEIIYQASINDLSLNSSGQIRFVTQGPSIYRSVDVKDLIIRPYALPEPQVLWPE